MIKNNHMYKLKIGLLIIACLLQSGSITKQTNANKKKFYITGIYHTKELNDCTLPPIEVEGVDRLDALTRTGVTVWTEEEWKTFNYSEFKKDCR
jgi:hypothetical protein